MTKYLLSLLLAGAPMLFGVPAAAAAPAQAPVAFERDGVRYVATVKTIGAATVISGYEVDSGKTFDLRAQNGHVTGTYGMSSVNYVIGR